MSANRKKKCNTSSSSSCSSSTSTKCNTSDYTSDFSCKITDCCKDTCCGVDPNTPLGSINIPGSGALTYYTDPNGHQDGECLEQWTGVLCVSTCSDFCKYKSLNFINGDLVIIDDPANPATPNNPTSLDDIFPELLGINGNLYVIDVEYQKITGFGKLRWVAGNIVFANNENLLNVPLFPSLLSVSALVNAANECTNGGIFIVNNKALKKVVGFEAVRQVHWGIFISSNDCLTHICGFLHLYRTDYVVISSNKNLYKITGFCYTSVINESLIIIDNNTNGQYDLVINAFLTLEIVDTLVVIGNTSLTRLELNALDCVSVIIVRNNPQLEQLCSSVKHADGIYIEYNCKLCVICFPDLDSISCQLSVNGNASLQKLDSFNALTKIGHSLLIAENNQLHQIIGFNKLKYIGSCCVSRPDEDLHNECVCTCVCDFDIIPSWNEVFARSSRELPCLVTDNSCDFFDDTCDICAYFLPNAFFDLICNKKEICGGEQIVDTLPAYTDYSIIIYGNTRLKCIDGFGSLRHLNSILYIIGNTSLSIIDAFGHLAFALDVQVRNNPSIKYIKGFGNLMSVRDLRVLETVCLDDWCNLKKLQFAQTIQIESKCADSVKLAQRPYPTSGTQKGQVGPIPSNLGGSIKYFSYNCC